MRLVWIQLASCISWDTKRGWIQIPLIHGQAHIQNGGDLRRLSPERSYGQNLNIGTTDSRKPQFQYFLEQKSIKRKTDLKKRRGVRETDSQ